MGVSQARSGERYACRGTMIEGVWRRVRTATCDRCKYTSSLTEKAGVSLPDIMIGKKFMARGWSVSTSHLVCPSCLAGKRPMAPAARRAAFCSIAGVPRKPKPEAAPMAEPTLKAEPPRLWTVEDRRRVRDALDTHYDEEAGRYRQSFSDRAIAAKLDVPVKLVADLREANGYGPDVNEAAHARDVELETLKAEIGDLQSMLLSRFDELERRCRKLSGGAVL